MCDGNGGCDSDIPVHSFQQLSLSILVLVLHLDEHHRFASYVFQLSMSVRPSVHPIKLIKLYGSFQNRSVIFWFQTSTLSLFANN